MDNITEKIAWTVIETEESFIFNTIRNFVKDQCQIEINKNDLISAIKLKQVCESNGYNIDEILCKANNYEQGFNDGRIEAITKLNNSLKSLLNVKDYMSNTIEKILEELK